MRKEIDVIKTKLKYVENINDIKFTPIAIKKAIKENNCFTIDDYIFSNKFKKAINEIENIIKKKEIIINENNIEIILSKNDLDFIMFNKNTFENPISQNPKNIYNLKYLLDKKINILTDISEENIKICFKNNEIKKQTLKRLNEILLKMNWKLKIEDLKEEEFTLEIINKNKISYNNAKELETIIAYTIIKILKKD